MTYVALAASPPAYRDASRLVWRRAAPGAYPLAADRRLVAEETPIAFSYEGASYAVMMASPADLDDFAVGFTLNEGIVASPAEIEAIEAVPGEDGIVVRMSLAAAPAAVFWERRRYLAGPSGCGLCGIESLAQAARKPPMVGPGICVRGEDVASAMAALPGLQPMNRITGALHAAAFWTPQQGIVAVREDVGRHNALDKLTGAAARGRIFRGRRRAAADQPGFGRDGAESSVVRGRAGGGGIGADRARSARRRERRHHPDRGGAARRVRSLHPFATHPPQRGLTGFARAGAALRDRRGHAYH